MNVSRGGFTVSGTTTVSGTLNHTNNQGAPRFVGLVTITDTGSWNTGGEQVTFGAGLVNNGTYISGTANQTFNGTGTIGGTKPISFTTVTITGAITNSGTLNVTSTLSGSGSLTNSATGILNIGGSSSITSLANAGTANITGTGAISTALANFTNTGTLNLSGAGNITGITNNSGGTVNLSNSGTITSLSNATATSTLNITDLTPTITTLTATAAGNTVNYDGAGSQPVVATTYSNLTLSVSGAKDIPATAAVNGNLTLSGTATSATAAAVTIGGNLTVGAGTIFATGTTNTWTLSVAGTTTVDGTLTLANTANKTFTGNITVNPGGIWNETGIAAVNMAGNLTNYGTYSANVGIHTFSGTTNAIVGVVTIPDVAVTGSYSNDGTLIVATVLSGTGNLTNSATGILNIGGSSSITSLANAGTANITGTGAISTALANFTNTGTLNLSGTGNITGITNNSGGTVNLSNSGTITSFSNATATSTLNITDLTPIITTLTATAAGNTVNYSGAGNQTANATSYSNLIFSGSGNKTMNSGTSVVGNLSIAPTGTAKADITAGQNSNVGTLSLGGITQLPGSWGSSSSAAANKNDVYFTATTGYLAVQFGPPVITSASSASFTYGTASSFSVVTTASPTATIAKSGSLPTGITFKDNGNGSAIISGTPNSSGTFSLSLTATNGLGTASQSFTLTVTPRDPATTSAVDTEISVSPNRYLFGTVANIPACGPPVIFTVRNAGSASRTFGAISLGGYDAAQYAISNTTCNGATLTTGQTCTVEVSFCPGTTGSKSAYLQVPSNDPETPVLTAMLYNHESLAEEAARRLPPVLQNLDIPSSCLTAGQPCTISWSLLGYDEDYLSRLVLFNCAGITNGTCGDSSAGILRDSGSAGAASTSTGSWSYTNGDTVYSKKFDYSFTFTTPAAGPVVIRFYRKTIDDDAAGLGGLSLLIPGNQNQAGISYYDNQGRRLQYQIQ